MQRLSTRTVAIAAVLLIALFAARLLHTATLKSFTIDEPHYAGTGLYMWRTGDYDWLLTLRLQPPLPFHLASVPLLLCDVERVGSSRGGALALARRFAEPPDRLRLLSRLPFVVVSCWGALLAFLWAREVAGDVAGLLALFVFSFSPSLLAYGGLAHSDMLISVLFLQTFYALWRWWRSPSALRLALCGVSVGLAFAAKITAVMLPIMLVGILAALRLPWRRSAGALAGIAAAALVVFWMAYGGSFRIEPGPLGPFESVPLPDYLRAFQQILQINDADHHFWFFGAAREEAPRWMLSAMLAVKTPLPVLLLAAAALARRGHAPSRDARLGIFLGIPIAIYLAIALGITRIPHGVRYLLPIHPLAFVAVGARLADLRGRRAQLAVAALCAWLGVISLASHPHYLSYFNELVGGPRNAHRHFADTNLDWGQDLITLADWLQQRGNPPVHTALFSVERPEAHGIRSTLILDCKPVETGLVAISASVLRGVRSPTLVGRPPDGCYDWLAGREPIAQPGDSILVYDLGGS